MSWYNLVRKLATGASPEQNFRSVFKTVDKDLVRWFPGHMGKGLKMMQHKLRSVDCIIEVHDARVPISGRNSDFKYTISGGTKPHILVLNKADLIEKDLQDPIKKRLEDEHNHIIFTNCKNQHCRGVASIFPLAQELIGKSERFNRSEEEDFNIMIIGVPNVGKSSLVNALRNRHLGKGGASPVGAVPGVTRAVLHKIKMCEQPLFYLVDTPGILTPKIANAETGLKLALCATLQDHLVGEELLADYLLYWMNKHGKHRLYTRYFKMDKPEDNILYVLTHISKLYNKTLRIRDYNNNHVLRPDFKQAAGIMLRAFRNGELGKLMLDIDLL
ncbi:unnamed protein product [Callosobruchus maculatus]|uniref:Mitochondrial GTPase 1 n=1 Tax=Callosobruchus maculatus TaxID=64391 RepID=A0A653D0I8_CALMS|nr:unnamed protein product [Callosobruchus maculatus]